MYNIEEKISSPRRQVEVLVRLLCSNILVIPVCDARYFTPLQTMCLLRSYIKVVIRNTILNFFDHAFFIRFAVQILEMRGVLPQEKKLNGFTSLCLKCLSSFIWLSLVAISPLQMTSHEQSYKMLRMRAHVLWQNTKHFSES